MVKTDIVCPLYNADDYIDSLILGLQNQKDVEYGTVVFAVTEEGDTTLVRSKIEAAGYNWFSVEKKEFSHSLTREKAVFDYCSGDVVVMLSQDVKLKDNFSVSILASQISDEVVFAYGRQITEKKNIEHYVRKKNYCETSYIIEKKDIEKLQLKAFFASDAFSAYHRPTFIALNGYDNIPMMMNEDMYYSKKVIEAGLKKKYVAEAVVLHSHKLKLKQLYTRYYETGKWFAQHPEFNEYKTTDSGFKLAMYVLRQAFIHFNIPVLFRWLPDMVSRYLGMQKGKKSLKVIGSDKT